MKKYIPITPLEGLQMLVASGGAPIPGLRFRDYPENKPWESIPSRSLCGVISGTQYPFRTEGTGWRECVKEVSIADGNNPANLTDDQVGAGYRLLTLEEITNISNLNVLGQLHAVFPFGDRQMWITTGASPRWNDYADGTDDIATYRTSRPAGYFLPKKIAEGHNPRKFTIDQVGEGWRLLSVEEFQSFEEGRSFEGLEFWHFGDANWRVRPENFGPLAVRAMYRTSKPAGFYLPKPKKLVPWTFATAPKGLVLTRSKGLPEVACLIVSWNRTGVKIPEGFYYAYSTLLEGNEISTDGGVTWKPAGTEVDA